MHALLIKILYICGTFKERVKRGQKVPFFIDDLLCNFRR
ncbi:MAG: hypothetical protein RIR48_453 [Bacteroidota bacterium]